MKREKKHPPEPQVPQHLQQLLSKDDKSNASKGAAITITLVAVALGFGCCENIVYIFVYNENSVNVGKLLHFCCVVSLSIFFSHINLQNCQSYWLA
jgi:RsiW-degrading membrane proteinase PrsW (M82 family)